MLAVDGVMRCLPTAERATILASSDPACTAPFLGTWSSGDGYSGPEYFRVGNAAYREGAAQTIYNWSFSPTYHCAPYASGIPFEPVPLSEFVSFTK